MRAFLNPTDDQRQLESLPGSFNCSNPLYSDIWALGPNSIRHACVRNGTQRSTWELSPDDGVFIRGQRAARSAQISRNLPTSYTMSFETKIERGGTGWVLDTALGGAGIWSAFYRLHRPCGPRYSKAPDIRQCFLSVTYRRVRRTPITSTSCSPRTRSSLGPASDSSQISPTEGIDLNRFLSQLWWIY